jgi:chemotaxis protein methyltransferase WspC
MKSLEQLLTERTGLDCSVIGPTMIERVVRRRMKLAGVDNVEEYQALVLRSAREYSCLLEDVVVRETWFFRDAPAFTNVARVAVEDWLPRHSMGELRVLSLPCSSGEEAFSIVMALLDKGMPPDRFRVDAIDISSRALAQARGCVYRKHAFRGKELGFKHRYFRTAGEDFELNSEVRRLVYFFQANLLSERFEAPHPNYDFIFFRNLLIYLDRAAQGIALQKIEKLLSPTGLLFVGPAEQSLALEWGLASAQMPLCFGCRRRPSRRCNSVTPRLLESTSGARNRSLLNLGSGPRQDLAEANRLADVGRLAEAAAICEAHLSQGQASAQVYYLLGLLRDARGDERAFDCYRKALYLDPNHYETLVHLAVLADKNGDAAAARNFQRRAERLQPGAIDL